MAARFAHLVEQVFFELLLRTRRDGAFCFERFDQRAAFFKQLFAAALFAERQQIEHTGIQGFADGGQRIELRMFFPLSMYDKVDCAIPAFFASAFCEMPFCCRMFFTLLPICTPMLFTLPEILGIKFILTPRVVNINHSLAARCKRFRRVSCYLPVCIS